MTKLLGKPTTRRHALLMSVALLALPLSTPVLADGVGETVASTISTAAGQTSLVATVAPLNVANEPLVVISQPGTPTTARDPVSVNGIGQMIVNNGGGSVGLCTGTLINPRTVLFAAHCVNTRAATAYGSGSGGTAIGFGFNAANNTTRAGQPAGTTPLLDWFLAGPNQFRTNTANFFYTANAVAYNSLSTLPGNGFLYGDVALASLDTPAANVPTWAILLSQLPVPTTTGPAGTGYHVALTGYGRNGIGTTGDSGAIDYRRRIAENWLGGLVSLDVRDQFLFGSVGGSRPQNLYWVDFDDPRRGTSGATILDFNVFRDNALPNEGITAGGDSGGPLILDRTFARQVVIGTLSGGSRFFGSQASSSYGTASFYQPLYLYWDWIAANNPYRYAAARAGDGNWNDPTRWFTTQDPNYFIIGPNGQLINGVPSAPGQQNLGTSGAFGEVCVQGPVNGGLNECLNVNTGLITTTTRPVGQGGEAMLADGTTAAAAAVIATTVNAALPLATIANGLPGASNFVPNNTAGVRTAGVLPRYFDVTLSEMGTITLDTAVTIDRFRLNGIGSRLDITSSGSLASLIDVTQSVGTLQVNGALSTVGDFMLMVGGINGTGTITAPFFTSILGVISPGASGTAGSFGTLNFRGNVILASGNTYALDLGANGASDRIAVARTTASNGSANLGGNLALAFSAATLRAGNLYTILTAEGGITGAFQAPAPISAILTPTLLSSANQVQLAIAAGQYAPVVSPLSRAQASYAALLDQNRASAAKYDALYGPLDLQTAPVIQATLEGMAPRTEAMTVALGSAALDSVSRFHRDRLALSGSGSAQGGTLTVIGKPTQLLAMNEFNAGGMVASDASTASVQEGTLPPDMQGFIAAGYVDGSSAPSTGLLVRPGRDNFSGYYVAAGIERLVSQGSMFGLSLSYAALDGDASGAAQAVENELYQGTLYGRRTLANDWSVDGQIGVGSITTNTIRAFNFLGSGVALKSDDTALATSAELGFQKAISFGSWRVDPRISGRFSHLGFSDATETGGVQALRFQRRAYDSAQVRVGFAASKVVGNFRPYLTSFVVHDFDDDQPETVKANFAGGIGPDQSFGLFNGARDWAEISAGVKYSSGAMAFSLGVDSTIGRDDVRSQSYRGSFSLQF